MSLKILCSCGNCDPARLARLGEIITEVLEKIPTRLKVIRHVRPKYACRLCERIFQAPAPELPIEKGRPGPGLLAHIALSKYCDGLPLYRQSGILAREGVEIDRTTMAEWIGHVAWWLRPLATLISSYVMAQPVIWTDDTPIRTLAPGTGKTRLSRFWCYAIDPRPYQGPGYPAVLYRYSPDRKGERPRSHLDRFNGYLHADAFAGYQALYRGNGKNSPRITHVACMAHARRKLFEVFEPRSRRSPRRHCGGSRNSMPLKLTSRAEPLTSVGCRGRRAASRCSMPSMSGRSPSDDGYPARHLWAKHCSMG
jgi:transposase